MLAFSRRRHPRLFLMMPLLTLLSCVAGEAPSPPAGAAPKASKLSASRVATKPVLAGAGGPPSLDGEDDGEVGVAAELAAEVGGGGFAQRLQARLRDLLAGPEAAGEGEEAGAAEAAPPKRANLIMMLVMIGVRLVMTLSLMYFRKQPSPSGVEDVIRAVGVEEGVSTDAVADAAAGAVAAAAEGAAGAVAAAAKGAAGAAGAAAAAAAAELPAGKVLEVLRAEGLLAAVRLGWAKLAAFARSPQAAPAMMVLLILSMKLVQRIDPDVASAEEQLEAEAAAKEAAEEAAAEAAAVADIAGEAEGEAEEEEAEEPEEEEEATDSSNSA